MAIEITQIETYDSAMILDQAENEWCEGWLKVYKRHKIITFHGALAVSTSSIASASFYCAPYSEFLLMLDVTIPGVASVIVFTIELSDDNAKWYELKDTEALNIQLSNADGNQKICLSQKCVAQYIRLKAVASAGTWTVTSKGVFIS